MQHLLPAFIFGILCTILIGCVLFLIFGGHRGPAKVSKLPPPPEPERYDVGYKVVEVVNSITGDKLFAPAWQDEYGCHVFFDNDTSKRIGHITQLCDKTCVFYRSPNTVLNVLLEHEETPCIGFKRIEDAQTFIDNVKMFDARSYYHE